MSFDHIELGPLTVRLLQTIQVVAQWTDAALCMIAPTVHDTLTATGLMAAGGTVRPLSEHQSALLFRESLDEPAHEWAADFLGPQDRLLTIGQEVGGIWASVGIVRR